LPFPDIGVFRCYHRMPHGSGQWELRQVVIASSVVISYSRKRLRSGPNRWQGYRFRKAMALLFGTNGSAKPLPFQNDVLRFFRQSFRRSVLKQMQWLTTHR